VNVVVLAGSVAADPVQRRMPSGDEVTERQDSRPSRWWWIRRGIRLSSMRWMKSLVSKLWEWLSRYPDDDPNAPQPAPSYWENPHGGGGGGAGG